ncbi:uncharacterized protein LOC142234342 [Haematobia irritans]|uniref:uncharacterized protein LOC142234342 n=1 Tax=Haematobia irritans TaxID=7368 RepID=UPI003F500BCE
MQSCKDIIIIILNAKTCHYFNDGLHTMNITASSSEICSQENTADCIEWFKPKWLSEKQNAQIGDLVLIADERCGPAQWLLGRIQDIHPGNDGRVRVVSVLTKGKVLKRPITKICFLPSDALPVNENKSPVQYQMNDGASSSTAVSRSTTQSID